MKKDYSDLRQDLIRCCELINSGVLVDKSVFTQSAFIEILIRFNHILQKLNDVRQRIVFNDDVDLMEKGKDVTDLINKLRNVACHIDSKDNYAGKVKFVFNTLYGLCKLSLGTMTVGCDYRDDIAYYYGSTRLYYKRHILRLAKEIESRLDMLSTQKIAAKK